MTTTKTFPIRKMMCVVKAKRIDLEALNDRCVNTYLVITSWKITGNLKVCMRIT